MGSVQRPEPSAGGAAHAPIWGPAQRYGLFQGKAANKSACQRAFCNSSFFGPLWKQHRPSKGFKSLVGTTIPSLLLLCRPATVCSPAVCKTFLAMTTRVVAVIVDAVDGMRQTRPLAYLVEKCVRMIPPMLADPYPASPVAMKVRGIWIVTSSHHPLPNSVRRAANDVCSPAGRRFVAEASAASRRSVEQLIRPNAPHGFLVARALAQPRRLVPERFGAGDDRPSLEFHSCRNLDMLTSHADSSLQGQCEGSGRCTIHLAGPANFIQRGHKCPIS